MRDVTADSVKALREARRQAMREAAEQAAKAAADKSGKMTAPRIQPGAKQGEVGINRMLARLRHVCSYAIRKGIVDATPFKRHGTTMVHLATDFEKARRRRLAPGEERRLLDHAGDHLRALVTAALETGMRLGELLGLRWRDVLWTETPKGQQMRAFLLSAEHTKTGCDRTIPISSRLRSMLEMRRHAPKQYRKMTGRDEYADDAYIFGNEIGERVASVKRAWKLTCKRAGITDLHFHDLRREFASRLMESGASLHEVQAWLGHANITMTSRYLGVTDAGLQRALDRFETARPWVDDDAKRTSGAQTSEQASETHLETPSDLPANSLN